MAPPPLPPPVSVRQRKSERGGGGSVDYQTREYLLSGRVIFGIALLSESRVT